MRTMSFGLLLLACTCFFFLPHGIVTTSHSSLPALYKFNATTDSVSSLQLANVYPLTKGNGMLIAEIDTGISSMYESHIYHNSKEIPNNGLDDDHNGYIDDYRGWNVLADTNNTYDDSITYHGTEVASAILRIAPNATILPIKYISSDNTIADYTDLLKLNDALDYISLFPVDVIVMAFNFNVVTPSTTLSRLQQLQNNGTLILVAAGNCDPSVAGDCGYIQSPANNNYVYAIGSIASDNSHSDFSAEGPQLAFVCYGQDATVYSPDYPQGVLENGTSFSVAQAAGLFALYKAMYILEYHSFNLTTFIQSLFRTAKDLGTHTVFGQGIPQIYTAYKASFDTDYPQIISYSYQQFSPTTVALSVKLTDQSGISTCTYQQKDNLDQAFSANQTCTTLQLLPVTSDTNSQLQLDTILSNASSYMQVKLYMTDLNYHQSNFTIQLSITLTTPNSGTTATTNTSVYNVGTAPTQTKPISNQGSDNIIGTIKQSTQTKTTPGLELIVLITNLIIIGNRRRIKT